MHTCNMSCSYQNIHKAQKYTFDKNITRVGINCTVEGDEFSGECNSIWKQSPGC